MKDFYYSAVARSKLAAQSPPIARLRRSLSRLPLLGNALNAAKRSASRILLPGGRRWVQAESGLAQGLWLLLDLDSEGGYWIGSYEPAVQDMLRKLCSPGSVFYDIGTSLGYFSLAIGNQVGPAGKVYGFEPETESARRFREMVLRNDLDGRITVVKAAAWSYSASKIAFRCGASKKTYSGVRADGIEPVLAEGEMQNVEAVSLDDFVARGHSAPNVIKIDVEGGECEVLKGARQIFSSSKPALVCEVHHQEAAVWIEAWLSEVNYTARWTIPAESFPRLLFARAVSPSSGAVALEP